MQNKSATVIEQLKQHREQLLAGLPVAHLFVFGSIARGEGTDTSDVDIIVEFSEPATFRPFMELKDRLELLLGMRVDLVTRNALRSSMRAQIEKELIQVA